MAIIKGTLFRVSVFSSTFALWSMAAVTAELNGQLKNSTSTMTTSVITQNDEAVDVPVDSDSTVFAKLCSAVILPVASIIASSLPVVLSNVLYRNEAKKYTILFEQTMVFVLFFGGGVLLYTVFLHLLPDLRSNTSSFSKTAHNSYSELIICVGFFIVYTLEQVLHSCLTKTPPLRSTTNGIVAATHHPCGASVYSIDVCDADTKSNGVVNATNFFGQDTEGVNLGREKGSAKMNRNERCQSDVPECEFGVDQLSNRNLISNVLTVVALSAHEIFEGMAVGLEYKISMVWFMTGAIVCHKTVLAAFIGLQMLMSKSNRSLTYIVILAYALTSSVGILVGLLVSMTTTSHRSSTLAESGNTSLIIKFVLQGIATGTLLYVVFFEIFAKKNEQMNRLSGTWKAFAAILGFVFMYRLQE